MAEPAPIDKLRAIMAQLRAPVGGCPWDTAQDFSTIAPYTIEEAYEVADAIDRGDILEPEQPGFLGNARMEHDLQQQVAKFVL